MSVIKRLFARTEKVNKKQKGTRKPLVISHDNVKRKKKENKKMSYKYIMSRVTLSLLKTLLQGYMRSYILFYRICVKIIALVRLLNKIL